MPSFVSSTAAGRDGLAALVADPEHALLGFDFDGTLSPIVEDPARAYVQPGMVDALAGLAAVVGHVAIITGRPARTAVELAGLDQAAGLEGLVILGQYGVERWDGSNRQLTTAEPPPGLDVVRREIDGILASAGVLDAEIEDKGLALAVHVRRSAAPAEAYQRLKEPLFALARRTGLTAEPGRLVIELRPEGMDKGKALLAHAAEVGATTIVFTGDDLGDLAAFDAVDAWRAERRPGLLVCSGSDEVTALAARADIIVDGPPGVLALVTSLTDRLTPDHPRVSR
jgi:trehalose 6-phosphate phosphatase